MNVTVKDCDRRHALILAVFGILIALMGTFCGLLTWCVMQNKAAADTAITAAVAVRDQGEKIGEIKASLENQTQKLETVNNSLQRLLGVNERQLTMTERVVRCFDSVPAIGPMLPPAVQAPAHAPQRIPAAPK